MSSSSPTPGPPHTLQVLFMGTGTSTGLPIACCLSNVPNLAGGVGDYVSALSAAYRAAPRRGQYDANAGWPRNVKCPLCRAAVDVDVPDGWKNRRGNPGLVLRKKNSNGQYRNVVVDVGKTFRDQSLRLFPRWGVQSIDAVLITHGHADAYYGLDDLREWCVRQRRAIPIYLTAATYQTVAESFPYLVDKTRASGGGDIPTLLWNVIDDEAEFEVEGISVTTLPVHHGRYFSQPTSDDGAPAKPNPFICLGYVFDREVVYLSDVSAVPERTWARMTAAVGGLGKGDGPGVAVGHDGANVVERPIEGGSVTGAEPVGVDVAAQANGAAGGAQARPQLLIVDTLWPTRTHASHFSFTEALALTARLAPRQAYFVGMTHPTTHYEWEALGRSVRALADEADDRALANRPAGQLNGTAERKDDGHSAPSNGQGALPTGHGALANDHDGDGGGADEHPEHETAQRTLAAFWADDAARALRPQLAAWARAGGEVAPAWDGLGVEVWRGGMRELRQGEGSAGGWFL
ncbi:hypothetical protein Q5752_005517 [Cryptotrichosporon argae]